MPVATTISLIQTECVRNNGGYVYFSQGMEPTRTLIRMLPYTKKGICNALAAKWIERHANDSSLWEWLFEAGTTNINHPQSDDQFYR